MDGWRFRVLHVYQSIFRKKVFLTDFPVHYFKITSDAEIDINKGLKNF